MARNDKKNKKIPDETIPGKAEVPDIRRDDLDVLKKGRTELDDTARSIYYDKRETPNPGRAERGEQGPPDENVTP